MIKLVNFYNTELDSDFYPDGLKYIFNNFSTISKILLWQRKLSLPFRFSLYKINTFIALIQVTNVNHGNIWTVKISNNTLFGK